MDRINTYIRSNLELARSIVFKSQDVALQMNREIEFNFGIKVNYTDMKSWKYYLNLSGEYHPVDTKMYINIFSDKEKVLLTKELLEDNLTYLTELRKFGVEYRNILREYPHNESLIRGMMFPVDIDKAIEADNGTILNYDETLVEEQETSLIYELEKFIKNLMFRWNVKEFAITDNLYVSALIAQIASLLPGKIFNIRLAKALTYEAHSFHITEFFNSHLDLGDDIKYLTPESKFWLYKNVRYLIKNIGKKDTLRKLIDNVFTKNIVGVGDVKILEGDAVIIEDNITDLRKPYYKRVNNFMGKSKNEYFELMNNTIYKKDEVIDYEMSLNDRDTYILEKYTDYYKEETGELIKRNSLHSQQTKILILDNPKERKLSPIQDLDLTIDNWFYLAFTGKFVGKQLFIDPNTNKQYYLSPLSGAYLFVFLLSKLLNLNIEEIRTYRYFNVLYDNITEDYLLKNLNFPEDTKPFASVIAKVKPTVNKIIRRPEEMKNYLLRIKRYYNLIWKITSNVNNADISGDMKIIDSKIRRPGVIKNDSSINILDKLAEDGWTGEIETGYDINKSLDKLLTLFTGMIISEEARIIEIMKRFRNIANKLTSYTVQPIYNDTDEDNINSFYNTIETLSSANTLGSVTAGRFYCLEKFIGTDRGWGNNVKEIFKYDGNGFRIKVDKYIKKPKLDYSSYGSKKIEAIIDSAPALFTSITYDFIDLATPKLKTDLANDVTDNVTKLSTYIANSIKVDNFKVSYSRLYNFDMEANEVDVNTSIKSIVPMYSPNTISTANDVTDSKINYGNFNNEKVKLFNKLIMDKYAELNLPISVMEDFATVTDNELLIEEHTPKIKTTGSDNIDNKIDNKQILKTETDISKDLTISTNKDMKDIDYSTHDELLTSNKEMINKHNVNVGVKSDDIVDKKIENTILENVALKVFEDLRIAMYKDYIDDVSYLENEIETSKKSLIEKHTPKTTGYSSNGKDDKILNIPKFSNLVELFTSNFIGRYVDYKNEVTYLENETSTSDDRLIEKAVPNLNTKGSDRKDYIIKGSNKIISKAKPFSKNEIAGFVDYKDEVTYLENDITTDKEEFIQEDNPTVISTGNDALDKKINTINRFNSITDIFKDNSISSYVDYIDDISYLEESEETSIEETIQEHRTNIKSKSTDLKDDKILNTKNDKTKNEIFKNNKIAMYKDYTKDVSYLENDITTDKEELINKDRPNLKTKTDDSVEKINSKKSDKVDTDIFDNLIVSVQTDYIEDVTHIQLESEASKEETLQEHKPKTLTTGRLGTDKLDGNINETTLTDIFNPLVISNDEVQVKEIDYSLLDIDAISEMLVELYKPTAKAFANPKEEKIDETNTDEVFNIKPPKVDGQYDDTLGDDVIQYDSPNEIGQQAKKG